MDYTTADRIMREIHLRKDWSIHWFQGDGLTAGQDTMLCTIRGLVDDSSSYPKYDRKSIATGNFVVRLSDVEAPADLVRIVLDNLIIMAMHEEREFLRLGPAWTAPFHPHTPQGKRLWDQTLTGSVDRAMKIATA